MSLSTSNISAVSLSVLLHAVVTQLLCVYISSSVTLKLVVVFIILHGGSCKLALSPILECTRLVVDDDN